MWIFIGVDKNRAEAVEEYLKQKNISCKSCEEMNKPQKIEKSLLSHWPVQIKLVPPHAPFLDNADLLILADCAAVAYRNLHEDFLKNKVVMMGCPKFDDKEEYYKRFSEIFSQKDINSITVLMMEVPCCSGLKGIVEMAISESGKDIPLSYKILSINGEIKNETF